MYSGHYDEIRDEGMSLTHISDVTAENWNSAQYDVIADKDLNTETGRDVTSSECLASTSASNSHLAPVPSRRRHSCDSASMPSDLASDHYTDARSKIHSSHGIINNASVAHTTSDGVINDFYIKSECFATPFAGAASGDITTDDYLQSTCCATNDNIQSAVHATPVARAVSDDVTTDDYLQSTCCATTVTPAVSDDVTTDDYLQYTCDTTFAPAASDDVINEDYLQSTCCTTPVAPAASDDIRTGDGYGQSKCCV